MDAARFDRLTRKIAQGATRRQVVAAVLGAALSALLGKSEARGLRQAQQPPADTATDQRDCGSELAGAISCQGEICLFGRCFSRCGPNNTCSTGQRCALGGCLTKCTNPNACQPGVEYCHKQVCLPHCNGDAYCPPRAYCGEDRKCQNGCDPNARPGSLIEDSTRACLSGLVCDPASRRCVRACTCNPTCEGDLNCDPDEVCEGSSFGQSGRCVRRCGELLTFRDAPTGPVATTEQAPPCPTGQGLACVSGYCRRTCLESAQCAVEQECVRGHCVNRCGGPADLPCPDTEQCNPGSGFCRSRNRCAGNNGCFPREVCDLGSGRCVLRCEYRGAPCPTGQNMDCERGRCVRKCDPERQPPCPEGYLCYRDRCRLACTGAGRGSCGAGEQCVQGPSGRYCTMECMPNLAKGARPDCLPGEICNNLGQCVPDPSGGALECPAGPLRGLSHCEPGCASDSDCSDGEICDVAEGHCVPGERAVAGCVFDVDCGQCQVCNVYGHCESIACDGVDCLCQSGQVCHAYQCVPACETSADCPAGLVCHPGFGACLTCYDDDDCPDELICVPPGGCVRTCEGSNDCPAGEVCYAGTCDRACASDSDCITDFVCGEERVCTPRCDPRPEGILACFEGMICDATGHCVPGA